MSTEEKEELTEEDIRDDAAAKIAQVRKKYFPLCKKLYEETFDLDSPLLKVLAYEQSLMDDHEMDEGTPYPKNYLCKIERSPQEIEKRVKELFEQAEDLLKVADIIKRKR